MFSKTLKPTVNVDCSDPTKAPSTDYKIALPVRTANIKGWYRFKIVSPKHVLHNICVRAFEPENLGKPFFSDTHRSTNERFTGYLYISSQIELVEIIVGLTPGQADDLSITLRPIALIEYAWHSIGLELLRRPLRYLSHYFRPNGLFLISHQFPSPPAYQTELESYQAWIRDREPPATRDSMSTVTKLVSETPIITILMPVRDPEPLYLKKALASVLAQTSPRWRLCIADDASTEPEIRQILDRAAVDDARVSLAHCDPHGGISAATNVAFSQASSPFVACLDHDDTLAPIAIEASARYLASNPTCRLLFSDEDKIDAQDNRFMPHFKPRKFSRDLFYSYNYINHLTIHHSETLRKIGGWRNAFDGAQDYDLVLRSIETMSDNSIHHIPLILYHWRAIVGSTALDISYKPYAVDAGKRALEDHFKRIGTRADVSLVANTMYRVRRELPKPSPIISIVIPFRDRAELLKRCVSSILEKTHYDNFEVILVDNGSSDPATLEYVNELRSLRFVTLLRDDRPFNYSRLNNFATSHSGGEYLCFLNNDTEVISDGWLSEMLSYASAPGVGCVGAKLRYPAGGIQHAGVVLGVGGVAAHVFLNYATDALGYGGRLQIASNYSAVTAACLLIKRSTFLDAGGFDEVELPVAFNDVDLCLKVQALGYRNVLTPFAELIHHESATRGRDDTVEGSLRFSREVASMQKRYAGLLKCDPCYSPHLSLDGVDCSLRRN